MEEDGGEEPNPLTPFPYKEGGTEKEGVHPLPVSVVRHALREPKKMELQPFPFILGTWIDHDEHMASEGQDIFPYIWMDQAAYAIADLNPPWAVRIEGVRRHWIYRVRRGACVFESLRGEPQTTHLEKDDIIGVTNDLPHTFRAPPNTSIPKSARGFEFRPPGAPESDAVTSILIGWVPYGIEPLITLFPSVFNVKADGSIHSQRLLRLLDLAELEIISEPRAPGSPSVLRRLSEVVVVELLRFTTDRMSGEDRGDVPAWISVTGPSRRCAALPGSAGQRSTTASARSSGRRQSATSWNFACVAPLPRSPQGGRRSARLLRGAVTSPRQRSTERSIARLASHPEPIAASFMVK